jgi:hypothetical protein
MRLVRTLVLIFLSGFVSISGIYAQEDTCPTLTQSALQAVTDLCESIGSNQICYGNIELIAEAASEAPTFTFSAPGDITDVEYVQSLQLSSMVTPDEWGIALMRIQARVPGTLPGQSVSMLMFGDVYIEDQASAQPSPLSGTITGSANLRSGPSTSYRVVGAGTNGEAVQVDARNDAGDWFRILHPETEELAWVFNTLIEIEGETDTLTVVEVEAPRATGRFGPMQAFFFRTGVGDAQCEEAPRDGILVQTTSGAGTVTLEANNVRIELGSTAYLTAVPSDYMTITLLEGTARVTSQGDSVRLPVGLRARVPLDANGLADGPPELVVYAAEDVAAVPVTTLSDPIALPVPLAEVPVNPFAQFEGRWNVGATPSANCSNGLGLLLGGTPFTATLTATDEGLVWEEAEDVLTVIDETTFQYGGVEENGTLWSQTFSFDDDTGGIYTIFFDVNGVSTYGCDESATVSAPLTRAE